MAGERRRAASPGPAAPLGGGERVGAGVGGHGDPAAAVAAAAAAAAAAATTQTRTAKASTFRPRKSHFDRERMDAEHSEYKGFVNLLLIYTFFYVVTTVTNNYRLKSEFLPIKLLQTMFQDIVVVGVADLVLILFSFSAFFHEKLVADGYIPRLLTYVTPTLLYAALFSMSYAFTYYRQWPWPQSGSLTMHTIVLFMKMYSYINTNRELALDHTKERPESTVHYPNNITLFNFIDFLLVPTLVYEPDYPRNEHGVRPQYLLEKALSFFGALSLLYLTLTNYIVPSLDLLGERSLVEAVLDLTLPFMVGYLLVFYIIFECVCNFMAEVTKFADRSFYDDWWNSSSFDEFSRKWNKPVHEWLLRHIYLESMRKYKLSKDSAALGTFFFSMILHELALTVAGGRFRPYITVLAMLQLPLISVMRHPMIKGTRLGNLFFWFSQIWGVPMLMILYAREHYGHAPLDPQMVLFFGLVVVVFFGALYIIRVAFGGKGRKKVAKAVGDTAKAVGDTTIAVGDTAKAVGDTAKAVGDTVAVAEAESSSEEVQGPPETAAAVPVAPSSPKTPKTPKPIAIKSPFLLFKHEMRKEIDPEGKMSLQSFSYKCNDAWNNISDDEFRQWEARYHRDFFAADKALVTK